MKLSQELSMKREEIEEIFESPIPWKDEADQNRCEVRVGQAAL